MQILLPHELCMHFCGWPVSFSDCRCPRSSKIEPFLPSTHTHTLSLINAGWGLKWYFSSNDLQQPELLLFPLTEWSDSRSGCFLITHFNTGYSSCHFVSLAEKSLSNALNVDSSQLEMSRDCVFNLASEHCVRVFGTVCSSLHQSHSQEVHLREGRRQDWRGIRKQCFTGTRRALYVTHTPWRMVNVAERSNVCVILFPQMQCKLYVFEKTAQSWIERGRGLLRLNDMASTDDGTLQSRLGKYVWCQIWILTHPWE